MYHAYRKKILLTYIQLLGSIQIPSWATHSRLVQMGFLFQALNLLSPLVRLYMLIFSMTPFLVQMFIYLLSGDSVLGWICCLLVFFFLVFSFLWSFIKHKWWWWNMKWMLLFNSVVKKQSPNILCIFTPGMMKEMSLSLSPFLYV